MFFSNHENGHLQQISARFLDLIHLNEHKCNYTLQIRILANSHLVHQDSSWTLGRFISVPGDQSEIGRAISGGKGSDQPDVELQ